MSSSGKRGSLGIYALFGVFATTMGYLYTRMNKRMLSVEKKQTVLEGKANKNYDEDDIKNDDSTETSEVEERLDIYESRITLLEQKISSMASHEKRISSLGVRVSDMQNHGQRLFQAEHRVSNQGKEIRAMEKRIDEISDELHRCSNAGINNSQRLDRLEIEKPVYTFFPGPSNGAHTGPHGLIRGILGEVHEPPIILNNDSLDLTQHQDIDETTLDLSREHQDVCSKTTPLSIESITTAIET